MHIPNYSISALHFRTTFFSAARLANHRLSGTDCLYVCPVEWSLPGPTLRTQRTRILIPPGTRNRQTRCEMRAIIFLCWIEPTETLGTYVLIIALNSVIIRLSIMEESSSLIAGVKSFKRQFRWTGDNLVCEFYQRISQ